MTRKSELLGMVLVDLEIFFSSIAMYLFLVFIRNINYGHHKIVISLILLFKWRLNLVFRFTESIQFIC